jgi:hypothetical protein
LAILENQFLALRQRDALRSHRRDSAEAAVRARGVMGKDGRFDVAVTFDERRGSVGTHPELRAPVTALSLGGLRPKVEAATLPEEVTVMLNLDKAARLERDRRLTGRPRPCRDVGLKVRKLFTPYPAMPACSDHSFVILDAGGARILSALLDPSINRCAAHGLGD